MSPFRTEPCLHFAPNHVSISHPQVMNDIYGHGANLLKDAWYDGGAGEHRNMVDTRIKAEHQAKRKPLANIFAQKTIANLEPVVTDTPAVFIAKVDKHIFAGKTINLRRYLNYFTIEILPNFSSATA